MVAARRWTVDGMTLAPPSAMDVDVDLARPIQCLREHAQISQSELARRLGVLPSRIVRLEQQGGAVMLATLLRVAAACGVRTVQLRVYDSRVIEKPRDS